MDSQFATFLREIVRLQLISVFINATALVAIMGGLLILGLAMHKGFQQTQATAGRIAQITAEILRDMRDKQIRTARRHPGKVPPRPATIPNGKKGMI
jgi:hypothetical protein